MQVGKLLYATDSREPDFSGVKALLDLKNLGLMEFIFLHATRVQGWGTRLAEYDITSKTVMMEGPVVPSILNAAHREGAPLIAASLNRDTRRLMRGSLTTALLRASALPVLMVPEEAQGSGFGQHGVFTRIVFAADWSAASEKAMGYILNFKDIIKELEIVHVIDRKLSVRDMGKLKEALSKTRDVFLDHGIDAEAHVYAGKPFEEIMLAARDYDATCICMGTAGKSFVKGLLSRSCACRVAETSVVPTLVVP